MKESNLEVAPPEISPSETSPEDIILEIRQEVGLMGANDFEMTAFNDILGRLRRKECTPDEAIQAARDIRAQKQDYH